MEIGELPLECLMGGGCSGLLGINTGEHALRTRTDHPPSFRIKKWSNSDAGRVAASAFSCLLPVAWGGASARRRFAAMGKRTAGCARCESRCRGGLFRVPPAASSVLGRSQQRGSPATSASAADWFIYSFAGLVRGTCRRERLRWSGCVAAG